MSSSLLKGSPHATPRNSRTSLGATAPTGHGVSARQSAPTGSGGPTFRRPNKEALSLSLSGASMSSVQKVSDESQLFRATLAKTDCSCVVSYFAWVVISNTRWNTVERRFLIIPTISFSSARRACVLQFPTSPLLFLFSSFPLHPLRGPIVSRSSTLFHGPVFVQ